MPRSNIWLSDNPGDVLSEHLSLLVGGYVPTKVILVSNNYKPGFDDQCIHASMHAGINQCRHASRHAGINQCRHASMQACLDAGMPQAHLRRNRHRSRVNWEDFVHYQVRANETYSDAKRQFSDRNRDVLMNVQSPHK